jgi:cytochrome c oxidase subunit 4
MADPLHQPGDAPATPTDPFGIRKDLDNPGQLVVIFLAVVGLALANIGLSGAIGPRSYTLPLQLTIASVQAALVAYYFMHLRAGDKVVTLTALASLFWMLILFVLFMADYMTRHLIVGGGGNP